MYQGRKKLKATAMLRLNFEIGPVPDVDNIDIEFEDVVSENLLPYCSDEPVTGSGMS